MVFPAVEGFQLTGFLMERGIGLVYLLAFLVFYRQYPALVGENGLEPLKEGNEIRKYFSIFYYLQKDWFLKASAITGVILSTIVLSGLTELLGYNIRIIVFVSLWILIVSFINSGGIFTRPGWETILAETGFIAIFLGGLSYQTPDVVVWMFRWVLFRMMLGSAIVKLRGGTEWTDLDALKNHFESQPFPGPFSYYLNNLPEKVLESGAVVMQSAMMFLPLLYFMPQPWAAIAGLFTLLIQLMIFLSGNYAWLNVITSVLVLSTFDDSIISSLTGISAGSAVSNPLSGTATLAGLLILVLSINPVLNFFSRDPHQNMSYNPLHLANSYGAFPDVTENHREIIIEGFIDGEWREYKNHSSFREQESRNVQIAPYQHMMEYLMYFQVHGKTPDDQWLDKLLENLLESDKNTESLFESKPDKDDNPEKIRAVEYIYRFDYSKWEIYWERESVQVLKQKSRD